MTERGTTGGGGGAAARASEWRPEGPGRWTRATAAQQTSTKGAAEGRTTGGGEGDAGEAVENPAKSRKCLSADEAKAEARAASDKQRAMELLEQHKAAEEIQRQSYGNGTGGFGSQAALSQAAQHFVAEVQRAEARAAGAGVEPVHDDGRRLLQLSPAELQQWVEEHLEEEDV